MRETPVKRGDGRCFHISVGVYTGIFRHPVGGVGNLGRVRPHPNAISKTPELHSRDLENQTKGQTAWAQAHRRVFHFSLRNYGYYCLFLLSISSFPKNPSRNGVGGMERHSDGSAPMGREDVLTSGGDAEQERRGNPEK